MLLAIRRQEVNSFRKRTMSKRTLNKTIYVESEKFWRAPDFVGSSFGLGEDILRNLKKKNPDKVFEVLHDSNTHVTVKEIHDQTITVAQNLLNLGVQKNDIVVIFTMLNLKTTPLTYACYTIGAPVCFFETYLEQEYVPQYLMDLDPTLIIYEEKFKPMAFNALKLLKLSKLKHLLSMDGMSNGQQKSVEELLFKPAVDIENFKIPSIGDPKTQPALISFTSGTTGLPKLIINSHDMIKQSLFSILRSEPGSVIMILSEIRWLCQMFSILQPGYLDVKRVYSSTPPAEMTGKFVCEMIDTQKVTHYFELPKFYKLVVEAAEISQNPKTLRTLKLVLLGGESIPDAFESYFAKITPKCILGRCYGMSDIGGAVVSSEFGNRKNVNGGILRDGMMVKIIDRDGNSLGPNEIGRIYFQTSAPFLGYLKNEKANKETFVEGGWMKTDDLGKMDSDNLLIVYTREIYVLRYADGKILMPNEIEAIVEKFDGVCSSSSALIGRPSKENPNEDCGTIFVAMKKSSVDIIDFENRLKDYLRSKLTPEQLQIVKYLKVIDDLPRTTCFKIDRIALRGMCDGGSKI